MGRHKLDLSGSDHPGFTECGEFSYWLRKKDSFVELAITERGVSKNSICMFLL
jgi:hypothetical protein